MSCAAGVYGAGPSDDDSLDALAVPFAGRTIAPAACVDGREMRKEVPDLPFFRDVRKRNVPLCFEIIRCESQRPRPVPEILLVM